MHRQGHLCYNIGMELALAALLVSSLTCVGLLALWAATSSRHWFLRTAVFVGTLSLLLLIPAYEPFVAFALQGSVVAAGVQLARRWKGASSSSPNKAQFSLATLLQAMVFVAIAAAVAAKVLQSKLLDWPSIAIIGSVGGLTSLAGFWMRYGSFGGWIRRLLIGLALAPLLSIALLLGDSFVESSLMSFFSELSGGASWYMFGLDIESPTWLWVPVSLVIALATFLFVSLVGLWSSSSIWSNAFRWRRYVRSWTTGLVLVAGWCCLALPSVVVYYHLVTPLPIPDPQIPEPNGYDDFGAAWAMLPTNLLVDTANFDARTNTLAQVRTAVNQVIPALERARVGLTRPTMKRIDYSSGIESVGPDIQMMRSLARAFQAQAILATREQDPAGGLTAFLDLIDYGVAVRRGGLILDELVGNACAGIARSDLDRLRTQLTAQQCRQAIDRLTITLANIEPHERFVHRDHVWMQQSYGWFSHLWLLLSEFTGDYDFVDLGDLDEPFLREQAEMRLLIAELALQAYRHKHGQLPTWLDELVPEHLTEAPIDPLSPDSSPLKYRRTNDGYLLYSVGFNGIDEGGATPEVVEDGWSNPHTGDMRLDIMFALEEEDDET
jgi:hypothetical protein